MPISIAGSAILHQAHRYENGFGDGQLNIATPLQTIAVGVVVERSKGASQWSDFLWRPLSVFTGVPATAPWAKLSDDGERATFFTGTVDIELHRAETTNYRDNLMNDKPLLWVVLRSSEAEMAYDLLTVTPPDVAERRVQAPGMRGCERGTRAGKPR